MFIKCNPEDFNYKRKNGFPILVSIMVSLKKNLLWLWKQETVSRVVDISRLESSYWIFWSIESKMW